jgi:hypothetical protein
MLGQFNVRQHVKNRRLIEKKTACNASVIQTDFPSSEWQKSQHSRAVENLTLN